MPSRYSPRDEDEYDQEGYDDYEEEGSEEGEEEGEKEEPLSKEEQEYLKLREQLKEKCRQNLKKENAAVFGKTEIKKKPVTNDNFGSFFGPSRPVIAARVLDESRCIHQNSHILSRAPKVSSDNAKDNAYTNSNKKQGVHDHQPRVVNEIKKKAQTLKDMRDYSFLLSDDADFPDAKAEPQPTRKIAVSKSDGPPAQASAKSKPLASKPRSLDSNSHQSRNLYSKNIQSHNRTGAVKAAALSKPKPTAADPRKAVTSNNGSSRAVVHKFLPSKAPTQITGTKKPPAKVADQLHLKSRPPSALPHSSAQKSQHSDQKRTNQSLEKIKSAPTKPSSSAKPQPSKSTLQKDRHEDRLKKPVPVKRRMDDDEEDAIGMIRKMFGYNPSKYSGVDDDDSDMEADFSEILKEERRSSKIAQKEDEEQLRLIEEEERRERMKKKQKLKR